MFQQGGEGEKSRRRFDVALADRRTQDMPSKHDIADNKHIGMCPVGLAGMRVSRLKLGTWMCVYALNAMGMR